MESKTNKNRKYKPSLICDVMELYRHLADDFLIHYCKDVQQKDFVVKTEKYQLSKSRKNDKHFLLSVCVS
jgi:CRISPR/Cas system-associated endonuclease Cas1